MSDLTGSTVLKDDEFETIISTPKKPSINLNSATRDQYPDMTDEEIFQQMGAPPQAQMAQQDQVDQVYREPQQAAKNITPDMMNQSLQRFQKATAPIPSQVIPPKQIAKPVAPPSGTMPSLKSEVTIPERPSPYSAKNKATAELERGYDEAYGHGFQEKEAALEAARTEKEAVDQSANVISQKGEFIQSKLDEIQKDKNAIDQANLKADNLQQKINEQIAKKISEEPDYYQRTLGDRMMWAISTFVAGLGGKGESVLNLLNQEIERKAKADAQRVLSMAKLYKPIKSNVDTKQLDKNLSIWEKERVNFYDDVASKLVEQGKAKAKTPQELAKWEHLQSALKEKKMNSKVNLVNSYYEKEKEYAEKKREENIVSAQGKILERKDITTPKLSALAINIPDSKLSFIANTPKGAEDLRVILPASKTIMGLYKELEGIYNNYGTLKKLSPARLSETKTKVNAIVNQIIREASPLSMAGVIQMGEIDQLRSTFAGGDPNAIFNNWNKTVIPAKNYIIKKISNKLSQEQVPKQYQRMILGY